MQLQISDREFDQFRRFIHDAAGISLADSKKALVCGRLGKRLAHRGLATYGDYYDLLASGRDRAELQLAIDLLTTNETYFFREPRHFEALADEIVPLAPRGRNLRVWSAACSTGEEPYTIAMVLAERMGLAGPWEILGTDISTRVLERARVGHYPLDRARLMPPACLKHYCLKGVNGQAGTLLVDPALRARIAWRQVNLNEALPDLGLFDVVFIRNVMIYFDVETKREVIGRIVPLMRPGAWLFVSHSENLQGIEAGLVQVRPSVFRKP